MIKQFSSRKLLTVARSPWLVVVGLAAFFAVIVVATTKVMAADDTDATNAKQSHVVTIYDEDAEKTVISAADNVADALKDAEISVNKYDKVEPALDQKLEEAIIIVNIRRARPVVVVDGSRQGRVITAAQNETDIAAAANIHLYPEDIAKLSLPDDLLLSGGAGLQMKITRAKAVNLKLYGQELVVRTQKNTVGELLKEKKIELDSDDGMNLSEDTKITNDMQLQIWRNGIQTITATEAVSFATKTVKDSTRNVGYHELQTTGKNGEKTVIYQIEMRDNIEISRTIISEVVNTPAVEQVEIIGTKVSLPPGSHEDWMRMAGISESDFGYVNYIVSHESGWNPNSVNRKSGACGLGQQYPCGKWAGAWNDPIAALKAMSSYVCSKKFAVYGSSSCWANAYSYWQDHGNY
jgi:uncharacterized protein YabE (DUF348 family)